MKDNLSIYLDPVSYIETQSKLSALTKMEKDAVISKGLSDGASVIMRETRRLMKQRVQVVTGNLSRSVKKTTKRKKPVSYVGFKRPGGNVAHLIDKGTADRWTKAGRYTGHVKPRYFHTDSVENKGEKALQVLRDSIEKSINRILNRK